MERTTTSMMAVDGSMIPAVLFAAEVDFIEPPGIALHLAPGEEHRVPIAQSALRHRPNLIRDQRGLVEHVPRCRGARVLAGKALRVTFFAGLGDDLPGFGPQLVKDDARLRARLVAAGIDVSEVRTGRKLGTRVMSVRDGTCGVHTLLLERTAQLPS